MKTEYPRDAQGHIIGYFSFEEDQAERTADGEDMIQFVTSPTRDFDDDEHDEELLTRLTDLLSPHFEDFEAGICESTHAVHDVEPAKHSDVMNTISDVLTAAGWKQVRM